MKPLDQAETTDAGADSANLVDRLIDKWQIYFITFSYDTISHTPPEPYLMCAVLWIQLILMRIRIRHFTLIRIRIQALSSKNYNFSSKIK